MERARQHFLISHASLRDEARGQARLERVLGRVDMFYLGIAEALQAL
jgi:hypothetical protein